MLQSYLVVAPEQGLAEELQRHMGGDFRLIPLNSVADLGDTPDERVAAVVIRMRSDFADEHSPAALAPAMSARRIAIDPSTAGQTLEAQVDELEQRIIEDSLTRNRRRRKETAVELGISRVTLYNKMKKFGIA